MNASDSLCASHAVAFNEKIEAHQSLVLSKNHFAERLRFGFAESLVAGETTEALIALAVFPELLSLSGTGWTVHCELAFLRRFAHNRVVEFQREQSRLVFNEGSSGYRR